MKTELLNNYIDNLTRDDIKNYISKESIPANESEIDIIYNSIKNDSDKILNNDFMNYLSDYKPVLNDELYNKIIEKYNQYKKFIE